jgi:FkbH-like protein
VLIAPGGEISRQAPRPLEQYDYALLQIPLRMVLPDYELFERSYDDVEGYQQALERSTGRLKAALSIQLEQLAGRPVFVLNYLTPMQSALGRLLPRYDLRNPSYFVEQLNRELDDALSRYENAHLLDVDRLSATIGRRLIQDDPFTVTSHGSLIGDYDFNTDADRLEASTPLSRRYPRDTYGFVRAAWAEAQAMMRTLTGRDAVKLVCVDIDDTLWRGVAAEMDDPDPAIVEGWPIGFAEALSMLRRRGIILALVSKNDATRIAEIWPKVFNATLQLSHFAIQKINWDPKPQNVAQAITEANVLPESVVFIDDNPVERAAVSQAIPGIRTLGAPHVDWRRVLLWSAETQVATITAESSRRTEMVRAQGEREVQRTIQSREEFLAGLDLEVHLKFLDDHQSQSFARAFELINKTNQFNTTGRRWTREDAVRFFSDGGRWWHFAVRDRFTAYGLVGVVIERDGIIDQFVLSCRVFGLGVEQAVLSAVLAAKQGTGQPLIGRLAETPRNNPCRSVYADAGWDKVGDVWQSQGPMTPPPHIRLL